MHLDAVPLREALRIVNAADAEVATVVGGEIERIALAVELIVERRRRDGHVYFAGAGTSGRLGVIEADEQTPTLDAQDPIYQSIHDGGSEALFPRREGTEDHADDG